MLDFLIHSPIAFFARRTPDHAAFSFDGRQQSYRDLDSASNRLANALVADGLPHGGRVGIYMHKSLDLGTAIYGTLKAGGVFVPLDPFMPVARLNFILADCGIEHVVSSDLLAKHLEQVAPTLHGHVYGISTDVGIPSRSWAEIGDFSDTPPDVWIVDQDLAYIMYTSGSTGQPKGMMHSHHGSISYARWGALHVSLTADDRVASHAPLHFDLSIFDFFSTSQSGATVVLVPESVTKFAASWSSYIEQEKISVVFTVPFTLIEMLQRGAIDKRDLTSLRWVLFGGEPFPPKHLRALMEKLPNVRFTNVYGPAEAPSCTCYDIPPFPEPFDEPIPIGTVSVNSDDLIVDEDDRECDINEPGELCIRSSTLMKGYWNRPDLNDAAYLLRDGLGHFSDVYYRTGDLVVRREDGLLRFLGRKDRMIKTRGHRVELDEVEAALASCADVTEAAAFVVPDGQGSTRILATVILANGGATAESDIYRHVRALLPGYAIPEDISIVDELPRTTSGKIDREKIASRYLQAGSA